MHGAGHVAIRFKIEMRDAAIAASLFNYAGATLMLKVLGQEVL
jgi:hypothetical protein